jgi:uncharacterized protein with WD repeat
LVTAQSNGFIQFWNTNTGTEINDAVSINENWSVQQLAYSSNDFYLAILSETHVMVWDTEPMQELTSFELEQATGSTI